MFFVTDDAITFESTEEEKKKYAPLPEGEYIVTITDAEIENDDKGDKFALTLQVDDHGNNFDRRKLWDTLYVEGRSVSPKAVEIGQKRLSQIFKIAGLSGFQSYEEATDRAHALIGQTLVAKVSTREWEGKTFNNVKSYAPVKPKAPSVQRVSAQPQAQARKGFK